MRKRITSSVALGLCLVLAFGPLLTSAASSTSAKSAAIPTRAKRPTDPKSAKLASRSKRKRQADAPRVQTSTQLPGQSATVLPDGRLLLVGGEREDGPLAVAVVRDLRTGTTVPMSNGLHYARAWHTATMLPDGRVLVFGGIGANGRVVNGAEVFDPESQSFELLLPTGSLTPRAYHTATLLTDGQVLIVGGVSDQSRTLNEAALWDFKTNQAVTLPSGLSAARHKHKATLLTDGNVLIEGGVGGNGDEITNAELYHVEDKSFHFTGLSSQQPDNSAPYLAASLPVNGAMDVPVDSRIALRFSKPLRVESLNPETVKLTGPEGMVAVKIVPAENGRLVFITPQEPLRAGTTYTVSLSGANDGGNALIPVTLTFTTAGREEIRDSQPPIDLDWIPTAEHLRGSWRSRLPRSSWQDQPPLRAAPGVTALAGQTLTLLGQPLANVTIAVGGRSVRTDNRGRFLVTPLTAGRHVMQIDGRTASGAGRVYGLFKVGVSILARRTNVLPYTIWMPRLDMAHATRIASPTQTEVVITHPLMPGLELRLPAGTVIRDIDGQTVTQISITPVPTDRPPFPLPPGYNVPVFFTIQPGGARIIPPRARLIYPNYTRQRAGARIDFWNYDPADRGWYIYGQGTVTADGRQIMPDPGVVLYEFGGIMVALPSLAPELGPAPGNLTGSGGDPVDLSTGLFVYEVTDLVLPDTMPIALTRTYRPNDALSRPFGIGTTHPYEMFLVGDTNPYTYVELILPDGGRIRYDRISPGTSYSDAVYEHVSTPTAFYKSKIYWRHGEDFGGWNLRLKDGTVYVFPDSEEAPSTQDAALIGMRDRYGNALTLTRGANQNLTKITSPNGRWIEFTYVNNRITRAKDNIGREVNYEYDPQGRLWKVTDAKGGLTEYTYDAAHRMLTIKDARGIIYLTNEYDVTTGRVIKQTQADTTTYEFAYTENEGRVIQTEVTDPRRNVRRVTFNDKGYVLTDTRAVDRPEQQIITYERQAGTNLVLSVTDPLGRKTAYTYHPTGDVQTVTRMADTVAFATTRFTYEPLFNQVASITDPLDHATYFEYDTRGNLITITDPLTHRTTMEYNAAGQPLSVTDALSNITRFGYTDGDLTTVTDPEDNTTTRRVDGAGRSMSVINALGDITRYQYDNLNQLTRVFDPANGVTSFEYDPNGNLLSVTDARNGATSYAYDQMDRLETRTDPLLQVERYEYNEAGNVKKFTDRRGRVTTYRYDGLDRRTFTGFGTMGEGETATYESTIGYRYDAADRLTEANDSVSGTITRSYNDLTRTYSETTPQTTPQVTVSYTHDRAGRLQTKTVTGQPIISYVYDDTDRLTSITQGTAIVSFGYDDADRRSTLTLPNGVVVEYGYNRASQLTALTYRLGATGLGNLTYEYDRAGHRTNVGGSYARSGLPQPLTSASYNAANQLTQRGTTMLVYDANGNLTNDGVNTYTWDARNQLISISGAVTASFQYDAFGRRISKTISGGSTGYLYDGANAVQELQGTTPVANLLTGGVDEVFTRTDGAGARTLLTDGLGSAIALTDAAGTLQTQYTYDAFGRTTTVGAASSNASQYTCRENDGATGLYYYRARYYSPALQRFISEDPIGYAGGMNLYAYVGNDPISFSDPFGLKPQGADPCAGKKGNLNFFPGGNRGIPHITDRHINAPPGASRFTFPPYKTSLIDKQTEAMNFAQETFNKATGYTQMRPGNPIAYVYAFPDFDYTIPGLSGRIGVRGFQDIGIDRDHNFANTNVMSLIVAPDCSSVITAFPGLPTDYYFNPNARITGTPHWWTQGRGYTWRR